MRLRAGLSLCLLVAIVAVLGCRRVLTPEFDRNLAPETWITAAPFDTITLVRGERPVPGTIPVRFHLYWAGSDPDGQVTGFYWAVTETLPLPPPGAINLPGLPGPKARDYRFTTRTDSVFIFNVAEDIPDRQHAFFIYAVDNLGKPDPTPARFVFNALNRFPPLPVFEEASAVGVLYLRRADGSVVPEVRTFPISDSARFGSVPRDTVPSGSHLTFRWRGEPTIAGIGLRGFRYKMDEPQFEPRDTLTQVTSKEYFSGVGADTLPIIPGTKLFTLRAVDEAGGSRDANRRFQLNFSPDTWYAGPDTNDGSSVWRSRPRHPGTTRRLWYAQLGTDGRLPPGGLPGSLFHADSTRLLPHERREMRTFFEIYRDTVFVRAEFDTVNMNSWVVFHNGGSDPDSPYEVRVSDLARTLPGFPGGRVLDRGPPNGSPIGFRSRVSNLLTPAGPLSGGAQSSIYPVFDPNDVQNIPKIGAYHPMFLAGKAYSHQRSEDADGARDGRIGETREFVERIDGGGGTAHERTLRGKVLVFYVNKAPFLRTGDPLFRPSLARVDTFTSRIWDLRLLADDVDPYLAGVSPGGPAGVKTFRIQLTVIGVDVDGAPLRFTDGIRYLNQQQINFLVPTTLAPGRVTLRVELCDCALCEDRPGQGRCIEQDIPVEYQPGSPQFSTRSASRPGLH